MSEADVDLYDVNNPAQALGQYRSWALSRAHDLPIDMVWISIAPAVNPNAHRVLPHGEPSIAILRNRDACGRLHNISLIICGPNSGAHLYTPAPMEELIAVRLKPEISAQVFGVDPGEFLGRSSGPRHAPPVVRDACSNALRAAHSCDAHLISKMLATSIIQCFETPTNSNAPEIHGAEIMRALNGHVSAGKIARTLDISERHFRRRFRDHLGVSPKLYARQLRLTNAAVIAEQTQRPDWAQIALMAGFHDQPHMINEFRDMIGMTPRMLHDERRKLSENYNQ